MSILREVTIGNIRLIQGDMRAVLPELVKQGVRAKLCLSDPPYRVTSGGDSTGEMGGCFSKEAYDNSGELFDMVEWAEMAPLIYAVLADDADAIIMHSDREEYASRGAFEAAGFGFHRKLIWHKVTVTPNRWYMPDCEFAHYLWKGKARTINDCGSKALIRCHQRDVSHHYIPVSYYVDGKCPLPHATEKPVEVMARWMVNSTDAGDLVLEPFAGSGSTLVAAVKTGRAAIGIEKNPMWFDVSVARVREAAERGQLGLFEKSPESAVQGALAV